MYTGSKKYVKKMGVNADRNKKPDRSRDKPKLVKHVQFAVFELQSTF